MHNLVVFMEPSEDAWDTSLNYGNMVLNRICIDEDAAFELSGVNYFQNSSRSSCDDNVQKGQGYTFPYHKGPFYFNDFKFFSQLNHSCSVQCINLPKRTFRQEGHPFCFKKKF